MQLLQWQKESLKIFRFVREFEPLNSTITVQHSIYHVPIGYKSEIKTKDEIIMCK